MNPKLLDSCLIDCRVQIGPCPGECNQCFYNHMPHEYRLKQIIPTQQEASLKIVRMNAEHDSNHSKPLVIETALKYQDSFFNTSHPDVQFPRPVVLTVNPRETDEPRRWTRPRDLTGPESLNHLMFIRYRVSAANYIDCTSMAEEWASKGITSVFTFMRYYDEQACPSINAYEKRKNFMHDCLQLKAKAKEQIMTYVLASLGPLVSFCGTLHSNLCKDCGNCEHYYYIAKRRMIELVIWR